MVKFVFSLIFFAAFLAAIIVLTYRTKTGKSSRVREYYAFHCIVLLIGLAGDTIYALTSGCSVWDVIAALFGVEIQEPTSVTVLSRVLAVLVFIICLIVVANTYNKWTGPISRRQFQMDTEDLENGHILEDFWVVAFSFFKQNYDLKTYQRITDSMGYGKNEITDELPWHLEFAKIYSLMSNQAHINAAEDWHPLQHCLISSYANQHKIAIYCTATVPNNDDLDNFLTYIHQCHSKYLKIIVAVKEGQRPNFTVSHRGQNVEYMFKCNALNALVDFSEYYRAIDVLYQRPLMENTLVKIEDIYVELDCCLESIASPFPLHAYVSQWLQEPGNRQLALLGDFGQGKTLFSTYLTYQMIHAHDDRIPILIPLRNKSPRNSSELEILSYFSAQYGINPEALCILNANGKLLLIFDGFDEMDLVGNDDIRKRHFRSLWKLVLPKSKVLVTGRPNYFLSRSEIASALGFQQYSSNTPYCEGLFLQPFREDQIMLALRSANESVQNGIRYIIDNKVSNSFLDLISRPSHLFLVSQIWNERQLDQKYQNLTSAVIINEFLQNCFERQAAKGSRDPYFYLSSIEREYFMVGIAARMYKMGATSISQDSFQNIMTELLDLFPDELSSENPVFLNLRNGKPVQVFAMEDDNSLFAIMNDVRTCGILVNDAGNSGLCFAHKSFYDVLVAKYFLGKNLKLHDSTMLISVSLSKSPSFSPRLKNDIVVRKLLAELISATINVRMEHSDPNAKCRKIFELCQKTISFRGLRRTPQSLFLRCMQEGENRNSGTDPVRWKHQKESKRLLVIYPFLMISYVLFFVQSIHFNKQYKAHAALFYSEISVPSESLDTMSSLIDSLAPYISIVLLCILVIVVLFFVSSKIMLSIQGKDDLVLLTWYYACKEHQISEDIVLQQFSKKYASAFLAYIQGKNFAEIQEQLEISHRKRFKTGKSQVR